MGSANCRPAEIQSDIAVWLGRPALGQMKYAASRTCDSVVDGCGLLIRRATSAARRSRSAFDELSSARSQPSSRAANDPAHLSAQPTPGRPHRRRAAGRRIAGYLRIPRAAVPWPYYIDVSWPALVQIKAAYAPFTRHAPETSRERPGESGSQPQPPRL